MPFMILLASGDPYTDPNGIICHQHQWHHMMPMRVAIMSQGPKSHVTSNFYFCGVRNAMVTLGMSPFAPYFCHHDLRNAMMPFASVDTDTGINGVTCPGK